VAATHCAYEGRAACGFESKGKNFCGDPTVIGELAVLSWQYILGMISKDKHSHSTM